MIRTSILQECEQMHRGSNRQEGWQPMEPHLVEQKQLGSHLMRDLLQLSTRWQWHHNTTMQLNTYGDTAVLFLEFQFSRKISIGDWYFKVPNRPPLNQEMVRIDSFMFYGSTLSTLLAFQRVFANAASLPSSVSLAGCSLNFHEMQGSLLAECWEWLVTEQHSIATWDAFQPLKQRINDNKQQDSAWKERQRPLKKERENGERVQRRSMLLDKRQEIIGTQYTIESSHCWRWIYH